MADVGVWMTQAAWPQLICDGTHPIRLGNQSPSAAPHDIFEAGDGAFVAIAVLDNPGWRALAGLTANERLAEPRFGVASARIAARDQIHAAIADWVRTQPGETIARRCQAVGVPASVVRGLGALVDDPLVAARAMIVEVDAPAGETLRLLGNPARLSRTPPSLAGVAPVLGVHGGEVLTEWLGLDASEIAALADDNIILAQRADDLAGV